MKQTVQRHLADIDRIAEELEDLSQQATIDSARKMIKVRSQLNQSVRDLRESIDSALAEMPQPAREQHQRDFNNRFGAFRTAVVESQAKWPSVVIMQDPGGYARSGRVTMAAKDQFIAYVRAELLPLF